jgi:hypothetical protein
MGQEHRRVAIATRCCATVSAGRDATRDFLFSSHWFPSHIELSDIFNTHISSSIVPVVRTAEASTVTFDHVSVIFILTVVALEHTFHS